MNYYNNIIIITDFGCYLAVPFALERGVMSMTPPSPDGWQTQVSDLPWAGGHFVPVGWAKMSPGTISSRRESRGTILVRH